MTKKEMKLIVTIIVIMLAILFVIVFFKGEGKEGGNNTQISQSTQNKIENEEKYVTELNDGTKLNNSEKLKEVKKYKNLEFSNIQFTSKNGNSALLATVTNKGSEKHASEVLKFTVYGENNEILAEPTIMISEIAPGETRQLNIIVTADVVNAKDLKIEAK